MNCWWLNSTTWSCRSLLRGGPSCWSQSNIPCATNENCLHLFGIEMTPSGLMRLCHPTDHVIPLKALTSSNRAGSPPEMKLRKVTVRALNSATWTLSSGRSRDLRKLDFCSTCSWLCWLTIVLHGGSLLELVRRTFIFLRVGSSSIFTSLVISSDYYLL